MEDKWEWILRKRQTSAAPAWQRPAAPAPGSSRLRRDRAGRAEQLVRSQPPAAQASDGLRAAARAAQSSRPPAGALGTPPPPGRPRRGGQGPDDWARQTRQGPIPAPGPLTLARSGCSQGRSLGLALHLGGGRPRLSFPVLPPLSCPVVP